MTLIRSVGCAVVVATAEQILLAVRIYSGLTIVYLEADLIAS